ncbi:MAG: hypothetical protein Q4Q31_04740 [Bacillota bacterium]|nr:hypothetical protein [Bacillota bacterium]
MEKKKKIIIASVIAVIAIVISLVFVFNNSNTKTNSNTYETKIKEAQKYAKKKNYEKAESCYLEAIEIDEKKKTAYLELSDVYVSDEKKDQAVSILKEGLEKVSEKDQKYLNEKLDQFIAKSVKFEVISNNDADSTEYGHIQGINSKNEVVWEYKTENHTTADDGSVGEIGIYKDTYYFNDYGTVTVLSLADGKVQWTNSDFGGMNEKETAAFDSQGTVYLGSYHGPEFIAIDRNGQTLKVIDYFSGSFYGISKFEVSGNKLYIDFEGCDDYTMEDSCRIAMNLNDYTYTIGDKQIPGQFTKAQLDQLKKDLGVPDDLDVTLNQDNKPSYWETGESWCLGVYFQHNGQTVAGAMVDLETAEPAHDILGYSDDY